MPQTSLQPGTTTFARRAWPGALALLVVLVVTLAPAAGGTSRKSLTCNPRGSWATTNAEANRYFRAVNPTRATFTVQRGTLSATFDHGQLTFGGLSLTIVGKLGTTTKIKEVIDMLTEAPYHMSGNRLVLGRGTYNVHYISVVITTRSGSKRIHLPDQHSVARANSVTISCTSSVLNWRVTTGPTSGVSLTFHRDRG
jgi:hypothetical protein